MSEYEYPFGDPDDPYDPPKSSFDIQFDLDALSDAQISLLIQFGYQAQEISDKRFNAALDVKVAQLEKLVSSQIKAMGIVEKSLTFAKNEKNKFREKIIQNVFDHMKDSLHKLTGTIADIQRYEYRKKGWRTAGPQG